MRAKVIVVSKLKKKYVPFEAKRELCSAYDIFVADQRVLPMLPPLLGKTFFKKKKLPVSIDLQKKVSATVGGKQGARRDQPGLCGAAVGRGRAGS